ncbi:MAG: hypothetical protein CMJ19_11345 [Phycisphaeraceae bacterium]|nr:hypothetical protein [Phycisphaeraceae bacterium]
MRITCFVNRIKLNRVRLGLIKLSEAAQQSTAPLQQLIVLLHRNQEKNSQVQTSKTGQLRVFNF